MSNPFFLTRQSANLMEDLLRELNQGSSLFLLYGEYGVGKSRLLQELGQKRLADRAIYWLDLDSKDGSEQTRMDRSAEVEALFAAAGSGDIIVADHFEMSLKKMRHQLFLSWSTDGIDRQLNLIIASSTEGFNELRQLSQQYGVRVKSFQQMPFSADEVQSFLGFYLFPDQPTGKLTIPSPLRKQIAAANGVVGRLIEIADRDGEQIKSEPVAEVESIRQGSRVIVYMLILVFIAAGIGWYLLREPVLLEAPPITINTPKTYEPAESAQPAEIAAASEPAQAEESAIPQEPDETAATTKAVEGVDEPVMDEPEVTPADMAEAETATKTVVTPIEETTVAMETEQGVVPDSEVVIDETSVDAQTQTVAGDAAGAAVAQTSEQRFSFELEQSMQWISKLDDTVGTIQILLLGYNSFNPDSYYEYVAGLELRGVDVEQLHVFKTLSGNREVYSVVYGEFASRKSANGAIESLPAVLRDTAPLARSVGGLWKEIQRLESKN
ncbi:MAG: SPOR domain-containing protein [Gammaproteobacteria bacterium]|nr:MAG: SPOR domain-containing protein [Gammaproteobacteria bacterium]